MSAAPTKQQLLAENRVLKSRLRENLKREERLVDFLFTQLSHEPQRRGAQRTNARKRTRTLVRYLRIQQVALENPRRERGARRESVEQFYQRVSRLTNVGTRTVARALKANPILFPPAKR